MAGRRGGGEAGQKTKASGRAEPGRALSVPEEPQPVLALLAPGHKLSKCRCRPRAPRGGGGRAPRCGAARAGPGGRAAPGRAGEGRGGPARLRNR